MEFLRGMSLLPVEPASMHMVKRAPRSSPLTAVFFRHMVANMRNGVLAISRDGGVVHANDEAWTSRRSWGSALRASYGSIC